MNAESVTLVPSRGHGWTIGLGNMLEKENGAWWRTRRWWILCVLWSVVLNGSLMMILLGGMEADAAVALFLGLAGAFLSIAAIILGQESLMKEKQSGTAAWVLTKPVSRPAFILSKMIANGLGLVATGIVLPGTIAWVQVALFAGTRITLPSFAAAMGLVCLNMFFYLALALMLATLINSRGPVLGITLGLLLGYQLLGLIPAVHRVPWLGRLMPWELLSGFGKDSPLVAYLVAGQPLPTVMPIIATSAWCVLFVIVGVWRFSREEF